MKKLLRSNKNRMVAGVCGGVAEYFEIDPTLIRVIWAVLSITGGFGVVAYIICAILIPENPIQG